MLNFIWKSFQKLTIDELYAALKLRSDVFIVEQQCPYADLDNTDQRALHLLVMQQNELVAYMRVFPPAETQPQVIFGRVVSSPSARGKGFGKDMMREAIDYSKKHFPGVTIKFSAQLYLQKFYESFGFIAYGDVYDEDGIPHVAMKGL